MVAAPFQSAIPDNAEADRIARPGHRPEVRRLDQRGHRETPGHRRTLRLAAGKYEGFTLIGRSHIHLIGPEEGAGEAVITGHSYLAVFPEAMHDAEFDKLTSRFDTTITFKDRRVWDLYRQPVRDFYLKNLVFDGEGVTAVDFPGVDITGPGGVLGFKGVRDALGEHCTLRWATGIPCLSIGIALLLAS